MPKQDISLQVLREKKYFEDATQTHREEWEELWKLYIGELGESKHKSLSQNFIPKTHQAVELLSSFLGGNEPSILAIPVGDDDADKALFMSRLLEYQWQYELKMKPKILQWIKSGILFGVGIMKVGWEPEKDLPFSYTLNLGNFYTDPFASDLEDSIGIERIVMNLELVKERYGKLAKNLKGVKIDDNDTGADGIFNHHDITTQGASPVDRVELIERWTKKRYTLIALQQDEKNGKKAEYGVVLKDGENPYGFMPYVPFRFKDAPLPNRFYTQGAIAPVKRVHKRMNQVINQIIDNVNLVMSPPAVIRRGSGVDPRELITFPGRGIYANDPSRDINWMQIPDTTGTGLRLYTMLDQEFQSGTTVTDIRRGVGSADTATEARIQQANLNTQTNLVKENVEHAIALIGEKLAKLNIDNISEVRTIRIFDPGDVDQFENLLGVRELDQFTQTPIPQLPEERVDIQRNGRIFRLRKDDIDGDYDIRIKADSTILQNREVLRKQLLDFAQFLASLGIQVETSYLAEQWGSLTGIPNVHKLVRSEPPQQFGPQVGPGGGQELPGPTPTETSQGVTSEGIDQGAGLNPESVSPLIQ